MLLFRCQYIAILLIRLASSGILDKILSFSWFYNWELLLMFDYCLKNTGIFFFVIFVQGNIFSGDIFLCGSYRQFCRVQSVLHSVKKIVVDHKSMDIQLGSWSTDNLYVPSRYRPNRGMLLEVIGSSICELHTPWGTLELFRRNDLSESFDDFNRVLAELEKQLEIVFVKIDGDEKLAHTFEYFALSKGELIAMEACVVMSLDDFEEDVQGIIVSKKPSVRSLHWVTMVNEHRIARGRNYLPVVSLGTADFEQIKQEWSTYAAVRQKTLKKTSARLC